MKLRILGKEDIGQLVEIEGVCFQNPWGGRRLEESLGLESVWALGLEEGGKLLGFGLFQRLFKELEILTLCILPFARRRGLGGRLLGEAKKRARAEGLEKLTLEVRETNEAALGLYKQEGFSKVGRRKGYYRDGEDALLMDCLLNEGT